MSNYDEKLRFENGGDTGENDDESIQPINDAERLYAPVLDRPPENLRKRSEIIKDAIENLNFLGDYDRSIIYHSTGTFALKRNVDTFFTIVSTQDLIIIPALVPNDRRSGGRITTFPDATSLSGARLFVGSNPYAGVLLTNDLWIFADPIATGQRNYPDGQDMNDLSVKSVGANDISVEIAMDALLAPGVIVFEEVSGVPTRHISIKYGDGTTIGQLVTAINNDKVGGSTQSQGGGTWGIGEMIRANTTTDPSITPLTGSDLITVTPTILQGSYDAEWHVVTSSQFNTFFATTDNRLREGEALVLAYPSGPVEIGGSGGRRQSLLDYPTARTGIVADNTGKLAAGAGMLVNAGLHPEQIPGAIPIGRMIDQEFVFAEGTVLQKNPTFTGIAGTPVRLGESIYSLATYSDSGGAALIGYAGSGNWNPSLSVAPLNVPASDLEEALDTIVANLASNTSTTSGSRRIGAESIDGSTFPSPGNTAVSLVSGSIMDQLTLLLYDNNHRVSEEGHRLHGFNPIEKVFSESPTAGGGGQRFRVQYNYPPGTNGVLENGQFLDYADIKLQPLRFNIGGFILTADVTFNLTGVGSANQLHLTGLTGADLTVVVGLFDNALFATDSFGDRYNPLIVQVHDVTGTATNGNGFYLIKQLSDPGGLLTLGTLDGVDADFTGLTGGEVSFFNTLIEGNGSSGRKFVGFQFTGDDIGALFFADDLHKVFTLHDNNTYSDTGQPSMILKTASCVFRSGMTFGSHNYERSTDRILIEDDFLLLNGIEKGGSGSPAPVDATDSHHHGTYYNQYAICPPNGFTPLYTDYPASLSQIDFNSTTPLTDDYEIFTVPAADYIGNLVVPSGATPVKKTVTISIHFELEKTPTVVLNFIINFRSASGGATPLIYQYTANEQALVVTNRSVREIVVTLPVNEDGNFFFRFGDLSGIESTPDSTVIIKEMGATFGF